MSEMNARHIYTGLKSSQVVQKIQQYYLEGTMTKETYELLYALAKDVQNLLINIEDDTMFDAIVKSQSDPQADEQ